MQTSCNAGDNVVFVDNIENRLCILYDGADPSNAVIGVKCNVSSLSVHLIDKICRVHISLIELSDVNFRNWKLSSICCLP